MTTSKATLAAVDVLKGSLYKMPHFKTFKAKQTADVSADGSAKSSLNSASDA